MNIYPTEEELNKIEQWSHNDFRGLMDFIYDIWKYADCGYWVQKGKKYHISTGGWSGNEDIIRALEKHPLFWIICWEQSRRGGHYIFHVR